MNCWRKAVFLICFIIVAFQLYCGTKKFLSNPKGTSTFTTNADGPVITVCHDPLYLAYLSKTSRNEINRGNLADDEFYNQSIEANTYVMDSLSKFSFNF